MVILFLIVSFFFQSKARIRREELQNSSRTSKSLLEDSVSCVFTLFRNKTTSKGKGLSRTFASGSDLEGFGNEYQNLFQLNFLS
jgi:hypothetical protein